MWGCPAHARGPMTPFVTHLLYLQVRAEILTTFALCGFANFSSIGIMLGGLSESWGASPASWAVGGVALEQLLGSTPQYVQGKASARWLRRSLSRQRTSLLLGVAQRQHRGLCRPTLA